MLLLSLLCLLRRCLLIDLWGLVHLTISPGHAIVELVEFHAVPDTRCTRGCGDVCETIILTAMTTMQTRRRYVYIYALRSEIFTSLPNSKWRVLSSAGGMVSLAVQRWLVRRRQSRERRSCVERRLVLLDGEFILEYDGECATHFLLCH